MAVMLASGGGQPKFGGGNGGGVGCLSWLERLQLEEEEKEICREERKEKRESRDCCY